MPELPARAATLLLLALPAVLAGGCSREARQQFADERFRGIYEAEWRWRREQLPGGEDGNKPLADHLPKVDPASQEQRREYWERTLRRVNALARADLSAGEQLNYDIYRAQLQVLIDDQRFRDFEMPANSDSSFWTDFGYSARRPFRTLTDYEHWIAQMRDIPRYFAEQEEEMRAGLKRGFTPPRVTLAGRDASITAVTNATPEGSLYYTPFREMPGIGAEKQAALRAAAVAAIREAVQPAYVRLLEFMRGEYLPGARTTLAAEALPDGESYYRAKIREFTTLDMDPAAIHELGVREVERLHAAMLEEMHATGFTGDFPQFLGFLRTDPRFYAKTPQELLMRAAWIAKVFDGKASTLVRLPAAGALCDQAGARRPRAVLHRGPGRAGCVSPQYLRSAEPPALQPRGPHAARVGARARVSDPDRDGAQGSARVSPQQLHLRLRRGLGALLREARRGDGHV